MNSLRILLNRLDAPKVLRSESVAGSGKILVYDMVARNDYHQALFRPEDADTTRGIGMKLEDVVSAPVSPCS
jgi:hypothetical protein